MDQELRRLRQALRQEKCPAHVRATIAEQIEAGRRRRRERIGFGKLTLSGGVLAALALATILPWIARERLQPAASSSGLAAPDHAHVVEQTKISLACIGYALLEAGVSTKTAVEEQTLPPLKDSLEKLKRSLSKQI